MYHVIKLNHKNPEGNEMNFQGNLIQFNNIQYNLII